VTELVVQLLAGAPEWAGPGTVTVNESMCDSHVQSMSHDMK